MTPVSVMIVGAVILWAIAVLVFETAWLVCRLTTWSVRVIKKHRALRGTRP